MTTVLTVSGVSKTFGGLAAVTDFRVSLGQGDLHGLIGPNGAGKTTCFNLLTGIYRPDAGSIRLGEQEMVGSRPHQVAAAGISRTFQNIRLFASLSSLDNVRVACHLRAEHTTAAAILRLPSHVRAERAMAEQAMRLLEVVGLASRAAEPAGTLPYGDQRRLEIARAVATGPKVLLLDEPAAGMNPREKVALRDLIDKVRREFALTVLLIEHDMGLVMQICGRITVLDHGVVIAEGTPAEVQSDPKVIEAYLGVA